MTQEELIIELEELAVRFSEGWHEGIKIDASDIMLLNKAAQALAQTQEPEYAWPTVADYERDVGFQTNEAFRMAWGMARTTNKMLGHPSPPQRTWVGLTDDEVKNLCLSIGTEPIEVRLIEAKLKELNT